MNCRRCGKENPSDAHFCSKCGLDLTRQVAEETAPAEAMFCYRHPKVETVLRCGRCERPICTKCAILGPAGPRCPECAKTNVAFRPGVIGLEAKRFAGSIFRMNPWTLWILVGLVGLIFTMFRGCASMFSPGSEPAVEQQSEGSEE